jgi:hypothetical protein
MTVERTLLLLADIGGYTEFMRLHRVNLAHSQDITQRLLESMLEAVPTLQLVEVEGDALFLSARHDDRGASSAWSRWLPFALDMYRAFHERQQWMVAHNLCVCDACRQIGRLRVKFAAHLGEVTTQTIRDKAKLFGVDVIAVHRMLKNTVPAPEYVLMSEPLHERLEPELREHAVPIEQELEGLGTMPLYFVDLDGLSIEVPTLPEPPLSARVRATMGVGLRAFPAVIGARPLRERP